LNPDETTRLTSHPNADAAKDSFFLNLTGVQTEDFDSFPANATQPLEADFGAAGKATLYGGGYVKNLPTGTDDGRYPISGDQYWDVGRDFYIEFTEEITAFGFYGVDIGDFLGYITLTYSDGSSNTLTIPTTNPNNGGSVMYYGFWDLENPFVRVDFGNTAPGADYFAFDDFTIATREQVDVPDPPPGPFASVPAFSPYGVSIYLLLMSGIAFALRRLRTPKRN
jgi:hypothetical protein